MNILIYKGLFQYNVVDGFVEELAEGFRKRGHNVLEYSIKEDVEERVKDIPRVLQDNKINLIVSFNGIGLVAKSTVERLNIGVCIILVDHPFYHLPRIRRSKTSNTFIICMCAEEQLHTFENFIDNTIPITFLMHGGTRSSLECQEKKYDVMMAGTIVKPTEEFTGLDFMQGGPLKEIGMNIYQKALENMNKSLDAYMDEEMKYRGVAPQLFREQDVHQDILANIYTQIDKQIRAIMRYNVLKTLLKEGIVVKLYGNCEIEELKRYPNLLYSGDIEYRELLNEMAASKILVHDVKVYANGSHERILDAMLAKTLVISNQNNYCNGDYIDKENIIFYHLDHLDSLTEKVRYYLNNDEERTRIVENACQLTSQNHTWKNRAEEIENIYEIVKNMMNI